MFCIQSVDVTWIVFSIVLISFLFTQVKSHACVYVISVNCNVQFALNYILTSWGSQFSVCLKSYLVPTSSIFTRMNSIHVWIFMSITFDEKRHEFIFIQRTLCHDISHLNRACMKHKFIDTKMYRYFWYTVNFRWVRNQNFENCDHYSGFEDTGIHLCSIWYVLNSRWHDFV